VTGTVNHDGKQRQLNIFIISHLKKLKGVGDKSQSISFVTDPF